MIKAKQVIEKVDFKASSTIHKVIKTVKTDKHYQAKVVEKQLLQNFMQEEPSIKISTTESSFDKRT